MAKMSLLSLSGSVLIKTTLMKHRQRHCGVRSTGRGIVVYEAPAESLWCTQTTFLSKQIPTIVADRRRDAKFSELIHFKGDLVL